jgi:hypothetical protein
VAITELTEGLETRLAEIDRKLREIQADLQPGREPRPTRLPGRRRGRSGPLAAALRRNARQRAPVDATLTVGPFADLEAVHAFERRLADLPGVRDAAVRGFEGTDRAIIDVQLEWETS